MSSSEDDYMSDAFLTGCVKEDIRPGLIHSHADKRKHEILKKKKEKDVINKINNLPKSFMEAESRDNALNQPISSDNKGFTMLQKLGFKPGSGLGKSSTGRTEPVPIKLKIDRQGLGRAEALKEIASMKANFRKDLHNKLTNVDNYRSHLAEKAAEKRAEIDLRKSQRICKQLDNDSGILEPDEPWFWPYYEPEDGDFDDDIDDNDHSHLNKKRRLEHDHDEEEANCEDSFEEEEEEDMEVDQYTVKEKLEMLTIYLRETYFYCIWCAVQYDDDCDMRNECPGPTNDDH